MINIVRCGALMLPLFLLTGTSAAMMGSIAFSGSVVEMGCWNDTQALEIQCHRQDVVTRHIIVENMTTPIAEPYAAVETQYLDEDKQLTLLRIVYD